MKLANMIRAYMWLYDTIRLHGPLTRAEINKMWMAEESLSGGNPMGRQKFNNYKNETETLFSISIACDEKYQYYIENENQARASHFEELLKKTILTDLALLESTNLNDRILLEPIPSAHGVMGDILKAMTEGGVIDIDYRRYEDSEVRRHRVEPYFLKQYHQRFYLLGRKGDDFMITLCLDRMTDVVETGESFIIEKDFDAEKYFEGCFGVVRDTRKEVERIVIRAFGTEPHYLRDLKLHHSQREINAGDGFCDFELYLRPTLDFVGKLMERGDRIKVLEPQHLAEEIREKHEKAVNLYE